jgi:hypothetical protein
MVLFDPNALPFYEVERGGGPVSEWKAGFDKALDAEQDAKLRRLDPRGVQWCQTCEDAPPGAERCEDCRKKYQIQESAKPVKRKVSGRNYQERRALGLCQTCEAPSPDFARCEKCREIYNNRPSREMRRKA